MENKEMIQLTDKKRTFIFINLIISGIATSILATAMTTALPSLAEYFEVSTSIGQWVTSGYSLAMGMVVPLTAFLITRFPTKKLYMTGIGSFIVGLLLSIFSGSFGFMMVGRVLQACGNGILISAAQVIILSVYPAEKKGTMMGTYGLATTAAPIIAPTVAGLMIDAFGWKSIFYLVLAIMLVSFVISGIVFEDVLEIEDKKFDVLSFVESIFAFGGITLGIGNISSFGMVSMQAGVPLLIGVVACVFFVIRQCGLGKPFLDVKILCNWNYAVSVISSMVLYLVMMGSSVMMPLYALMASNIGMFFLTRKTPLIVAASLNMLRNISIGGLMMPLLTWGTSNVDFKKMADATSLLTSFRTIAGSIGSAVFVGIMTVVSAKSVASYGDNALMHGMNISFLWMFVGSLVLLLISLFGCREKGSEF